MKKLLNIVVIGLFNFISAQVPRQEQKGTFGDTSPLGVVEMPIDRTAPDEVSGVSYENDGKKSFFYGQPN